MSAASARKRQTPETAVTHLFCFAAKLLTAQKRLQPLKSPLRFPRQEKQKSFAVRR